MTWHPRDPTNKDADMGVEELLDNGSTAPERSQLRWKPAPAIMLAGAVIYAITIITGSITITVINNINASVARICIENNGQWVISETGDRECKKAAGYDSALAPHGR